MRKMVGCILLAIFGFAFVLFVIGLCLPRERIVRSEATIDASPEIVYKVLIDNDNWKYRTSLAELQIVQRNGDIEEWIETSKDGAIIHFMTKEKRPYSFYSFGMESKLFKGYWTAEIQKLDDNKTHFIATEYVEMKNPIVKVLSYLFFDLKSLMVVYQNDLITEIERRKLE